MNMDRFSEHRNKDRTLADVEQRERIESEKADRWRDQLVDREKTKLETPAGECVVCGSNLLIAIWRGIPENICIHCNGCGTEVVPRIHELYQP